MQELLDKLDTFIHFSDTVSTALQGIDKQRTKILEQNEMLVSNIKDLDTALGYYKKSVDIIYERTIKDLETQLSELMQEVFSGCDYGIHFTIEDLRGTKNLIIELFDEKFQGAPEDMGGSLETVAGYLFHLMYLKKSGKPRILFLDEMFKDIHNDYLINMIELINKLAKATNTVNVLITHTEELECVAEQVFMVENGNYTLISSNKGLV